MLKHKSKQMLPPVFKIYESIKLRNVRKFTNMFCLIRGNGDILSKEERTTSKFVHVIIPFANILIRILTSILSTYLKI